MIRSLEWARLLTCVPGRVIFGGAVGPESGCLCANTWQGTNTRRLIGPNI